MIFRWMLLLLALALPATTTLAGSYRVIFGGAITEIDSGAPDSFSIGERVFGTYEFNTEPEWTISITEEIRTLLTASPNSTITLVNELRGTGPLLLMTESGFVATDTSSEISTSWTSLDASFPGGDSTPAAIGNGGRFSSRLLADLEPRNLHTFLGPTATGIELHLNDFALSPALVADDIAENGKLNHPLHRLIDPNSFESLTGGIIAYGSTAINPRGLPPAPTNVHFDIDTLRIVAIPEPATLTLLLLAMLATFRPTPLRRAGS